MFEKSVIKLKAVMKTHFSELVSLCILIFLLLFNERDKLFPYAQVIQQQEPKGLVNDSSIIDVRDGNLEFLETEYFVSKSVFIMGYAPWDAESHSMLSTLKALSERNAGIEFVLVNCFFQNGSCQNDFKVIRYPVFMFKMPDIQMLVYEGPYSYFYIQKWLLHITQGYKVVKSDLEIKHLLHTYQSVVIGCFDFKSFSPKNLKYFFLASISHYSVLKSIIYVAPHYSDPELFSCPLMGSVFVVQRGYAMPSTYLINGNSTNLIIDFVDSQIRNVHHAYKLIVPSGVKSRQLLDLFDNGNHSVAMIVFDKFDLPEQSVMHSYLQIINDFYSHCNETFDDLVKSFNCEIVLPKTNPLLVCSLFFQLCSTHGFCDFNNKEAQTILFTVYEQLFGAPRSKSLNAQSHFFLEKYVRNYCRTFLYQIDFINKNDLLCSAVTNQRDLLQSLYQIRCSSNQTLHFTLFDKDSYPKYLSSLGIHVKTLKPVAIIVNMKLEMVHKRNVESLKDLITFVQDYHSGSLTQFRRFSRISSSSKLSSVALSQDIIELNSLSFEDFVLNEDRDLLVLFMDQTCGFCLQYLTVLSQLADFLDRAPNITLAYIDISVNDVHPRFHPLRVPFLVLYPRAEPLSPIVFPYSATVSLTQFVVFMVRHSSLGVGIYSWTGFTCSRLCVLNQIEKLTQHVNSLHTKAQRAHDTISSSMTLAAESRQAATFYFVQVFFLLKVARLTAYLSHRQKMLLFDALSAKASVVYKDYCDKRQRTTSVLRILRQRSVEGTSGISWKELLTSY